MKDDDRHPSGREPLEELLGRVWRQPRVRAIWEQAKRLHGNDRLAAGRAFVARVAAEPDLREGLVEILAASYEAELAENGQGIGAGHEGRTD